MQTMLGKIENVRFGFGGYQDAMIGLHLEFSMQGSGITTFVSGGWKEKRADSLPLRGELVQKIIETLKLAKVDDVTKLKNVPVEIVIDHNRSLHSWRILEEVL